MDQEEREKAQSFEADDPKKAAALALARDVIENRGHVSDDSVEEARQAGYTDEQVVEMVANVALTTFSNYFNDTIGTEVDVPVVEPVHG